MELSSRLFSNDSSVLLPRDLTGKQSAGKESEKVILVWGLLWAGKYYQFGKEKFDKCDYRNCRLTHDSSELDHSDAVVMELQPRDNPRCVPGVDLPPYRPNAHQQWIYYQQDSPATPHLSIAYHCLDGKINATMTPREDADIHTPLLRIEDKVLTQENVNETPKQENHSFGKSKLAAWYVNECQTQSKREIFVKELMGYIPIDVYGKCGFINCEDDLETCFSEMGKTYKFYFSFENSICADHVTDFLLRALKYRMVPVVIGGADYQNILPKSTYIDVRHFDSPQAVALYLKQIDANNDMYNKYIENYIKWEETHYIHLDNDNINECELCKFVNTNTKNRVYEHVRDWLYKCTDPADYYSGLSRDTLDIHKDVIFKNERDT